MTTKTAPQRVYTVGTIAEALATNWPWHEHRPVLVAGVGPYDHGDERDHNVFGADVDGRLVFQICAKMAVSSAKRELQELSGLIVLSGLDEWLSDQVVSGNDACKLEPRGDSFLRSLKPIVLGIQALHKGLFVWDPILRTARPVVQAAFISDGSLAVDVPGSVQASCANAVRERIAELLRPVSAF